MCLRLAWGTGVSQLCGSMPVFRPGKLSAVISPRAGAADLPSTWGWGPGPEASRLCTPLSSEAPPSGPGYLDGPNPDSSMQPCEVSSKPLGLICCPQPAPVSRPASVRSCPVGRRGWLPLAGFPGLWGLASLVSCALAAPCTFKLIPKRFFLI